MRVLHVIPSVAARDGGPSAAIVPMCRALANLGTELVIATTDADGNDHLDVPLNELTRWRGIPTIFFRSNVSDRIKYSRGLSRWLHDNVKTFNLVHVHALLSHASLAAAAAARRAHVKYVIRPLGTLSPWSLGRHAFRKKALLTLGARRLLLDASAIHCTSEQEHRDLETAMNVDQCVVIPLGIEPQILSEPVIDFRQRGRYCLAMSRIHPKKNLEAVIEAFLAASPRLPWRLVVAGNGDPSYVDALRRRAEELGGGDRVTFVGWVDGDAKCELIGKASLFVLGSFHENFGLSVLEALARGVPAITTRHVDLAEQIGAADAGWIAETDRQSLTDAFADALIDDGVLIRKSEHARTLAMRFAWPVVADRLVSLYRHLIDGGTVESFPSRAWATLEVSLSTPTTR